MKQKKFITKRQKSKYEEDCYDASSLEENYDVEIEVEDEEDDIASNFHEDNEDNEDNMHTIELTLEIKDSVDTTKPKKRGPKPNKAQYYVDPKDFDDSIVSYYETNIISDELALMINKIAHKLSYAPNFINYTYRDEMVGDAVVRMMKALIAKKYEHAKGRNPFSYFTKIAFNAFRNRIKREKYAHEILQKYQEEVIMNSEYVNFLKNKKNLYSADDTTVQEE